MAAHHSPLDEAYRAQRALAAVSEILIGVDDLHVVRRDNLSTLLDLIGEHLDQSLDAVAEQLRKPLLKRA